ncbi:hypothetical protein NHX12_011232 [Muraenolepis orangiensis]|uniref:Uncharacterized protein n=1 Tax=Muraenolepis orangiensis TaxID=630683 RepID=A0A9Q0I6Z4_9TELE|nr:hypothetical protein NHX12_011232 [Muraenolepis orangiensis]
MRDGCDVSSPLSPDGCDVSSPLSPDGCDVSSPLSPDGCGITEPPVRHRHSDQGTRGLTSAHAQCVYVTTISTM